MEMGDEDEVHYARELAIYAEALKEEDRLEKLFFAALAKLNDTDTRWEGNYNCYRRWNKTKRIIWIYQMQERAEQGLPMAQQLMAAALAIRMAG